MTSDRIDDQNRSLQQLQKISRIASLVATLLVALACSGEPANERVSSPTGHLPTPHRSQVQVIEDRVPEGLTDANAISAYQQGYVHMRNAAWFSAIAAYDEAVRIQPDVAGLYEARGTAYMYSGRHDHALADYGQAIELDPADANLWRRRAHAHTIAPTPQPEKGVLDATLAIELDPTHRMGYGHRAVAYTQLRTPEWENALADMDRHIELFPGHDPEAYRFRAWVHDNLGNAEEA